MDINGAPPLLQAALHFQLPAAPLCLQLSAGALRLVALAGEPVGYRVVDDQRADCGGDGRAAQRARLALALDAAHTVLAERVRAPERGGADERLAADGAGQAGRGGGALPSGAGQSGWRR